MNSVQQIQFISATDVCKCGSLLKCFRPQNVRSGGTNQKLFCSLRSQHCFVACPSLKTVAPRVIATVSWVGYAQASGLLVTIPPRILAASNRRIWLHAWMGRHGSPQTYFSDQGRHFYVSPLAMPLTTSHYYTLPIIRKMFLFLHYRISANNSSNSQQFQLVLAKIRLQAYAKMAHRMHCRLLVIVGCLYLALLYLALLNKLFLAITNDTISHFRSAAALLSHRVELVEFNVPLDT